MARNTLEENLAYLVETVKYHKKLVGMVESIGTAGNTGINGDKTVILYIE